MRFIFILLTISAFAAPKKEALILCSYGGYSHQGAAKTITKQLESDYHCTTIYPINDYKPFGMKDSEQIYNFLFCRGWNRTIEMLSGITSLYLKVRAKGVEQFFERVIRERKPDIIISVAPWMNGFALNAAAKHRIPFLLITLDNHMWMWLSNMQKPKGSLFKLAMPRLEEKSVKEAEERGVAKSDIVELGQLLRPEFQAPIPSKEVLRKKHAIPENKKVILIMMGGAGSSACVAYAKKVGATKLGVHVIVCTGHHEVLAQEIEALGHHPSNSIQAMRFTDDMAELMGLADLMILKPGPSAIHEGLSIGRAPLLLDTTIMPILWERGNVNFVTNQKMGEEVGRVKRLPRLVKKYLFETNERSEALAAIASAPKNHSCAKLQELVEELTKELQSKTLDKSISSKQLQSRRTGK